MRWIRSSLKSLVTGSRGSPLKPRRKRSRPLVVEHLEGRRLLSRGVEPIATVPINSSPMIAGPDGDLWVAVSPTPTTSAIDRIGLNGSVTEYPVPQNTTAGGLAIGSLAVGADGNIWFGAGSNLTTNNNKLVVGYVTPAGQVTELPPIAVPAGTDTLADYGAMASGPGGDVWFGYSVVNTALENQNLIARVTPDGSITQFPISSLGTKSPFLVYSLTAGADGNLWFTEGIGKAFVFGKMSPSGVVTKVPFHQLIIGRASDLPSGGFALTGMNRSLDQEVYQTTTAGAVQHVHIPASISSSFNTYLGSADGSLWFTDEFGNISGRITIGRITKHGVVTSYNLSRVVHNSSADLSSMAIGQDGNLYLLDSFQQKNSPFVARVYRLSPHDIP